MSRSMPDGSSDRQSSSGSRNGDQSSANVLDAARREAFGPPARVHLAAADGDSSKTRFSSKSTVYVDADGKEQRVLHDPPRGWNEVLRDVLRQMETRNGELEPRQRSGTVERRDSGKTVPQDKLVGFFREPIEGKAAESATMPIRVLKGQTIISIIGGEPFGDVGEFGKALYKKAYEELKREGHFKGPMIDDGQFTSLERMFAEKVAEILPDFRRNYKPEMKAVDNEFYDYTKKSEGARSTEPSRQTESGRTAGGERATDAVRPQETARPTNPTVDAGKDVASAPKPEFIGIVRLEPEQAPNVLKRPLIHDTSERAQAETAKGNQSEGGSRPQGAQESLGSYTDFRGETRSIYRPTSETLMGIARKWGVLPFDSESKASNFTAEEFKAIGEEASNFRRDRTRTGGGTLGPENTEFCVRVFRAMGLTNNDLWKMRMSPEALGALFDRYISTHAGDSANTVAASKRQEGRQTAEKETAGRPVVEKDAAAENSRASQDGRTSEKPGENTTEQEQGKKSAEVKRFRSRLGSGGIGAVGSAVILADHLFRKLPSAQAKPRTDAPLPTFD